MNLKLPFVSASSGDSGFGASDFSIKMTRVAAVTPTHGIILSAEAVFDTADAPDRGTGVDVLKLSGSSASFLKTGAIFALSGVHSVLIGNPDPGRSEVNLTTIDLYYVPWLANPKAYMTFDPAIIYNWENDKMSGALAVTYGQAVDLGILGNECFFLKPGAEVGGNRAPASASRSGSRSSASDWADRGGDLRRLTEGRPTLIPKARTLRFGPHVIRGEPDRIRTCDPLIKSQLLYQLSYRPHEAAD